ncbi:unannotated protein [freshwater metagenome]|uniref:Unannotated protein n=1 Tax=freshwater metagenome TaxID=449393 RepID=A0A6J7C002_9ZZZZ
MHLADRRRRGRDVVELGETGEPVLAESFGHAGAHRGGRHRGCGVLKLGQRGPVRGEQFFGQCHLENAHGLAELHRAALEFTEGLEDLLGRPLLDLTRDELGVLAADPLTEPECGASCVPERERGQAGTTAHGTAGKVGHTTIVRVVPPHPHPQTG